MNVTNSSSIHQTGALDNDVYHQGTLHCSWKDGFPHYVFSKDNKGKVFITTNLLKVKSFSDEIMDYVYTFHSRAKESNVLAEMSVSTSFVLCPHGSEIIETQFVLCATDDNIKCGKNKQISKNVGNNFRGPSCKQRRFAMQESSLDLNHETGKLLPLKLELIAIVTKDYIHDGQKEVEIGGWGLKFLKRDKQCESCRGNTSMNVLVPAGFHGGPKTRNSGGPGPSSLVERWRSGGSCECGGWDLGCPLTVLHAQPNHENGVSFDLLKQGCKQSVPVLKMVEVRGDLYDLRYKSTLSDLQSLSIVVAAIHSRNPNLRHVLYAN